MSSRGLTTPAAVSPGRETRGICTEGAFECLDEVRGRGAGKSGEPGKSVSASDGGLEAKDGDTTPGETDS